MTTERISRRDFVEAVGMTAGASAVLGAPATVSAASANEKIRLALIGAGSRGNQLLDTSSNRPTSRSSPSPTSTTTTPAKPPSESRKTRATRPTRPAIIGPCSTAKTSTA